MATKNSLADTLARELGFKDAKALKENLKQKHGGDFAGNVKSRLEEGGGFGESFGGAAREKIDDIKGAFSKKGLKKLGNEAYREVFSGDDIFSSYMRGRLNKKERGGGDKQEPEGNSPTPEKDTNGTVDITSNVLLKIIAKNSLSLPGMARDVNILKQNIVKLTQIEADSYNKDKKTKDKITPTSKVNYAHHLKPKEMTEKLNVEKSKYTPTFIKSKNTGDKNKSVVPVEPAKTPVPEGGGILDSIISFFKDGLLGGFASLFNPMAILKLLGKVFVIGTIIMSLFQGITAAFETWKETGDLKEAIISGLGAIVDFLTFGLFGKDSVRDLFDKVGKFLDPIIQTVSGVITSIKDWIVNNVGIPQIQLPTGKVPDWVPGIGGKEFNLGTIGPYYPFKSNPKSSEVEVSSAPVAPIVNAPPASSTGTTSSAPTPAAAAAVATPSTSPTASGDDKYADKAESNGLGALQFLKRTLGILPDKNGFIDMKNGEKILTEEEVRQRISSAGKNPDKVLKLLNEAGHGAGTSSSGGGGVSAGSSGGGSISAGGDSGGGGGGGDMSAGGSSPSAVGAEPSTSGESLGQNSAQVAEMQRGESSADAGSVTNSPTTNNTSGSTGNEKGQIADVYDSEFAKIYAAA